MRRCPCHALTTLLALAACCSAVIAEDRDILMGRGSLAIGLPLPSHKGKGVSIWLVRSKTMVGLEIDGYSDKTRVSWFDSSEDRDAYLFRSTLTIKRFRSLQHDVAPFWYQAISTELAAIKFGGSLEHFKRATAGVGFGMAWFPWQRTSLSLRQGVEFAVERSPGPKSSSSTHLNLSMRLLALFHF